MRKDADLTLPGMVNIVADFLDGLAVEVDVRILVAELHAIDGGADWVQLITWNDYGEHTEIAPSTGTQHAFYDLTAYYTAWFKTGAAPRIVRDGADILEDLNLGSAGPAAIQSALPLDENERALLAVIHSEPRHIDELAEEIRRRAGDRVPARRRCGHDPRRPARRGAALQRPG